MARVLFQGTVNAQLVRVVDRGVSLTPRLIVEGQQTPDAMGAAGWVAMDPITRAMFEALLLAAGVVT